MDVKVLEPGDHIFVRRGLYTHHGIFCGDDEVIHYSSSLKTKFSAEICATTLSEFAQNTNVYIALDASLDSAEVIIRRAKSRLGERCYNLLFNNCEHFATFCRTGTGESSQVNVAVVKVAVYTPGGSTIIANSPAIAGAVGKAVSGITSGGLLPGLSAITPSLSLSSLPAMGTSALRLAMCTGGISLLVFGVLNLAFVVAGSHQVRNADS